MDALITDLIDLCAHFRAVIAAIPTDLPDAPFNMTLTKRADWLEANVINPCERLLDAIAADKHPMFATWPYPLSIPELPDHTTLRGELEAMRADANALRNSLRAQQEQDAGHSQELRAEIFAAIAKLLSKHAPHVKPTRGVYDCELRRYVGVYVDAFDAIYVRITGVRDNLDRQIRGEIEVPS